MFVKGRGILSPLKLIIESSSLLAFELSRVRSPLTVAHRLKRRVRRHSCST